ncbi:MAG: thioredoxin [Bacteroides sp.]|nr:thioredoxin [Bacteroides sp.]MDE6230807.1 thioredoxin [Muribaculaceae bacterium]
MALQFNDASAKEAIESGKVVVIDFWATWCGPCIAMGPVVDELAEKYGEQAVIGKLNIDEESEIVSEYRVRSIPTILFFKNGEVVDRSVGKVKYSELESKLLPLLG